MKTLAEATGQLHPAQAQAIDMCEQVAQAGAEHIDDLAFVSHLMVTLIDAHDDGPIGWCLVAAHRALLDKAADEGLVPTMSTEATTANERPRPPRIECHPGNHCSSWPGCESCGPARL
jgi:hypothetical protein